MKLSSVYQKAFEDNCINLVVDAYNLAITEKRYQSNWIENDFSELFKYYINNKQFKVTFETEKKLPPKDDILERGYGDKLARIDFYFSQSWKNIARIECYMEAKILKEKDSNLKRAYISEGMDRYISRKYPLGCMLGYLIEGGAHDTINGINSLLVKDKRNSEILSLISCKQLNSYYESTHSEVGLIRHLILDFTNPSSPTNIIK